MSHIIAVNTYLAFHAETYCLGYPVTSINNRYIFEKIYCSYFSRILICFYIRTKLPGIFKNDFFNFIPFDSQQNTSSKAPTDLSTHTLTKSCSSVEFWSFQISWPMPVV